MPPLLAGLRVVDIATTECGARATQFLADHGATVEMIERPGGCPLRQLAGWPALARGKHSRVLDVTTAEGQQQLADLVATADVVVHSMRPSTVESLGFGYDSLSEHNRRLIV